MHRVARFRAVQKGGLLVCPGHHALQLLLERDDIEARENAYAVKDKITRKGLNRA